MWRRDSKRAIAIDPSFSLAYSRLAFVYFEDWFDTGESAPLDKAFTLAKKAVALDLNEGAGHQRLK
jgi:hypothetical protein